MATFGAWRPCLGRTFGSEARIASLAAELDSAFPHVMEDGAGPMCRHWRRRWGRRFWDSGNAAAEGAADGAVPAQANGAVTEVERSGAAAAAAATRGPFGRMLGAAMDVKETKNAYAFAADMPGVGKEHVKVQLQEGGQVLSISGERLQEAVTEGDSWHRSERRFGTFSRRFRLPKDADTSSLQARMEDGVLRVTVPKTEPAKPDPPAVIDIPIA